MENFVGRAAHVASLAIRGFRRPACGLVGVRSSELPDYQRARKQDHQGNMGMLLCMYIAMGCTAATLCASSAAAQRLLHSTRTATFAPPNNELGRVPTTIPPHDRAARLARTVQHAPRTSRPRGAPGSTRPATRRGVDERAPLSPSGRLGGRARKAGRVSLRSTRIWGGCFSLCLSSFRAARAVTRLRSVVLGSS